MLTTHWLLWSHSVSPKNQTCLVLSGWPWWICEQFEKLKPGSVNIGTGKGPRPDFSSNCLESWLGDKSAQNVSEWARLKRWMNRTESGKNEKERRSLETWVTKPLTLSVTLPWPLHKRSNPWIFTAMHPSAIHSIIRAARGSHFYTTILHLSSLSS